MSQRKRRPSASRPTRAAEPGVRNRAGGSSSAGRTDRSRPPRAATGGAGPVDEPPSAARRALERASIPLLLRLQSLPSWLVPLIMLVLALTGLLVQGPIGFAALAVVATFLGWLALLSWPVLKPRARVLRVLAVGIVATAAVTQLLV